MYDAQSQQMFCLGRFLENIGKAGASVVVRLLFVSRSDKLVDADLQRYALVRRSKVGSYLFGIRNFRTRVNLPVSKP